MDAHPTPSLRSLTLTVTEQCNLRCSYCNVPKDRGRTLPDELADRAVDLLARHAAGDGVTLSFYGGEPALAFDTVKRSARRARAALGERLRVLMPTNGLLLSDEMLAACRDDGVELAVSVDGVDGDMDACERVDAKGHPSAAKLWARVPALLAQAPDAVARMTVTPANVEHLSANVKAVARFGFRRIYLQPAYEEPWTEEALAAWAREQRRIGCWLAGALAAGAAVPELPAWRAIAVRLATGQTKRWCGAGSRIAAVGPDGGLHPCYRLVFHADPAWRMGDVERGFEGEAALRLASFDPERLSPEQGECESCDARDGCTHACPALGVELAGDPAYVPAVACELMRAQVAAVRFQLAASRRALPRRSVRRRGVAAAALAAAAIGAAAPSCASSVVVVGGGGHGGEAGSNSAVGGAGGAFAAQGGLGGFLVGEAGGLAFDAGTGGICDDPPFDDAGADAGGGGICPISPPDAGGGICPPPQDDDAGYGGGVC